MNLKQARDTLQYAHHMAKHTHDANSKRVLCNIHMIEILNRIGARHTVEAQTGRIVFHSCVSPMRAVSTTAFHVDLGVAAHPAVEHGTFRRRAATGCVGIPPPPRGRAERGAGFYLLCRVAPALLHRRMPCYRPIWLLFGIAVLPVCVCPRVQSFTFILDF
jgi:hypothetical protein